MSSFRDYFDPARAAPLLNHSTGQIALHLHELLGSLGPVVYVDDGERPRGLAADLYVGHFWAFAELCDLNEFEKKVAFYSVSDPAATRRLLFRLAEEFEVPMPLWDLPPASFDHERTMELADLVLVVGNSYTLETFPARWHPKIKLLDYAVDTQLFGRDTGALRRNDVCFAGTCCGLRKGFLDVLRVWEGIDPRRAVLHVVGRLDPPFDELLRRYGNGAIVCHGWLESRTQEYVRVLQSCRFAHLPTYSEGQMGTLLEALYAGCVPITTRASGIDDRVLEHCVVVEPLDVEGQRAAVEDALSWSDDEYAARQKRLGEAVRSVQTWAAFGAGFAAGLAELGIGAGAAPVEAASDHE